MTSQYNLVALVLLWHYHLRAKPATVHQLAEEWPGPRQARVVISGILLGSCYLLNKLVAIYQPIISEPPVHHQRLCYSLLFQGRQTSTNPIFSDQWFSNIQLVTRLKEQISDAIIPLNICGYVFANYPNGPPDNSWRRNDLRIFKNPVQTTLSLKKNRLQGAACLPSGYRRH